MDSKRLQLKYVFEQRSFPFVFFGKPDEVISLVLKSRDDLRENLNNLLKGNYFSPEMISAYSVVPRFFLDPDNSFCCIVKMILPDPEDTLLGKYIYLCYDSSDNAAGYFIAELSAAESLELCARTKTLAHVNFGEMPESEDEYQVILKCFMFLKENSDFFDTMS